VNDGTSPTTHTSSGAKAATARKSEPGRRKSVCHPDPSQWIRTAAPLLSLPTAQASVADVAVTADRPCSPGDGTRLQCVPSQCSMTAPEPPPPTAQASLRLVAVTPRRTAECAGVGTTSQRVPSQCSTNAGGRGPVSKFEGPPTAHASSGASAATACNSAPGTTTLGATFQTTAQAPAEARAEEPSAASRPATSTAPDTAAKAERRLTHGAYAPANACRVADGTRTRDHRDHNPELYQLSYRHREVTPG
jgi:hypothetical protein